MSESCGSVRDAVFRHIVRDVAEQFDSSPDGFEYAAAPPARIRMNIEESGDFWLSGNSEGYLHLARVFAELGLRPLEDGYHFHMNADFHPSRGQPEFSFEIDNTLGDAELRGTSS